MESKLQTDKVTDAENRWWLPVLEAGDGQNAWGSQRIQTPSYKMTKSWDSNVPCSDYSQ